MTISPIESRRLAALFRRLSAQFDSLTLNLEPNQANSTQTHSLRKIILICAVIFLLATAVRLVHWQDMRPLIESGKMYLDFQPSNLEVTTVDVGNPATNVIPAAARATFNIRFNTDQNAEALERWITGECDAALKPLNLIYDMKFVRGAHPFLTKQGAFTALLERAITSATGDRPNFSTTGGTSDARFIHHHCPVAEIGLAGTTMHKTDECVKLADLERLTKIYEAILTAYFEQGAA